MEHTPIEPGQGPKDGKNPARERAPRACCLDEAGSVMVIFVLALAVLTGIAAIVVDLGHAFVVRRELQRSAEAGANAGARALALPNTTSFPNWGNALNTAKAVVRENKADGALLSDFAADNDDKLVQTGFWDIRWTKETAPVDLNGSSDPAAYYSSASYNPTYDRPAVKVTIAKTNAGSGTSQAISTYFASLMGFKTMQVRASAVSILDMPPPVTIPAKSPILPLATPQSFVTAYYASGQDFRIYSDHTPDPLHGGNNGGQWTSLKSQDNSDSNMQNLIEYGNDTTLTVGADSIYIVPGTKANLFNLVGQNWAGKTLLLTVVADDYLTKQMTPILGLIAFYVGSVGGHGANSYIEGHFVKNFTLNNGGTGGQNSGGVPPVSVPRPRMVN